MTHLTQPQSRLLALNMTRTKTFWMRDQITARPLPVHDKHSGFEQARPGVRAVGI